jgi:cell pole-organizing protein PopZ
MQSPREPSMEDILASIKRVIAEEKELRAAVPPPQFSLSPELDDDEDDVLELDHPVEAQLAAVQPAIDPGPPLMDEGAADSSRAKLEQLSNVAAAAPPPPTVNPLEEMLRDMLRPVLKQWLDENLPKIVDEHVRREISRITGKPL